MRKHQAVTVADELERAKTFEDLCGIALSILSRMPGPVVQVCGPITSGGAGTVEKNLAKFQEAIHELGRSGLNVFDQLIFEESMFRIKENASYFKGGDHLLEAFYLPIFKSGYVKKLYFLPDWRSSYGARWEHEYALRLGIEIVYL